MQDEASPHLYMPTDSWLTQQGSKHRHPHHPTRSVPQATDTIATPGHTTRTPHTQMLSCHVAKRHATPKTTFAAPAQHTPPWPMQHTWCSQHSRHTDHITGQRTAVKTTGTHKRTQWHGEPSTVVQITSQGTTPCTRVHSTARLTHS